MHDLLARTHQPKLGYHQCIDEFSRVLSMLWFLDCFVNVAATITAVVGLQAVLKASVGILKVHRSCVTIGDWCIMKPCLTTFSLQYFLTSVRKKLTQ